MAVKEDTKGSVPKAEGESSAQGKTGKLQDEVTLNLSVEFTEGSSSVKDLGPGSPEDAKRVFDQYESGEPFPVPKAELSFGIRSKVRVSSNGKSEVSQEIMSDEETKALANELLGQETDEEAKRKEK